MYLSRLLKILSGIILLFTCISFGQISEVHAGNLNSEESRLLEYVNRTFEQDGLSYKVNSSYKAKLRDKLMQDDIDLTAGDVEMIIGEINNNVATGVESGYLVLINEPTKAPTATEIPTTDESTQETVEPSKGTETETNTTETETNGTETDANTTEIGTNSSETEVKQETETSGKETETSNQGNSVPNENNSSNDSNGGNTDGERNQEDNNEEVTTPLKNTGYSIKTIPYLAAGFLILMLFGILSMYVINYIEVSNETKK